jgi:hypothetical protein
MLKKRVGFPAVNNKTRGSQQLEELGFFDCDSIRITYFDAAFAAKTFFSINRNGFSILDFKYFYRAYIYALFTTFTFFSIYDRIKSHFFFLLY